MAELKELYNSQSGVGRKEVATFDKHLLST